MQRVGYHRLISEYDLANLDKASQGLTPAVEQEFVPEMFASGFVP